MLTYSFFVKKYKTALIFVMLFIINYTALSSSSNIFLSDTGEGKKQISLVFDNTLDINGNFYGDTVSSGSLVLADDVIASYVKIKNDTPAIILKVNLNNISSKSRKKILKQLTSFITKQDTPVILYGDFGAPSWNRYLRRFMVQTRLSVKNRLLFSGRFPYNILSTPSFYILGFSDMGIDNLKAADNNKITFDVLF